MDVEAFQLIASISGVPLGIAGQPLLVSGRGDAHVLHETLSCPEASTAVRRSIFDLESGRELVGCTRCAPAKNVVHAALMAALLSGDVAAPLIAAQQKWDSLDAIDVLTDDLIAATAAAAAVADPLRTPLGSVPRRVLALGLSSPAGRPLTDHVDALSSWLDGQEPQWRLRWAALRARLHQVFPNLRSGRRRWVAVPEAGLVPLPHTGTFPVAVAAGDVVAWLPGVGVDRAILDVAGHLLDDTTSLARPGVWDLGPRIPGDDPRLWADVVAEGPRDSQAAARAALGWTRSNRRRLGEFS